MPAVRIGAVRAVAPFDTHRHAVPARVPQCRRNRRLRRTAAGRRRRRTCSASSCCALPATARENAAWRSRSRNSARCFPPRRRAKRASNCAPRFAARRSRSVSIVEAECRRGCGERRGGVRARRQSRDRRDRRLDRRSSRELPLELFQPVQQFERFARRQFVRVDGLQGVAQGVGFRFFLFFVHSQINRSARRAGGSAPRAFPDTSSPGGSPASARRRAPPPAGRSSASAGPSSTACRNTMRVLVLDRVEVDVGRRPVARARAASARSSAWRTACSACSSRAGGARSPRPAPGRRRSRCRGRSRPSAPGCARWRCAGCSALSVISTMKVERPPARSSEAPMRVKIWSIGPMRARLRRHEAADVRQQRDQRHLAHVGGLAAHVRAGDQQQLARAARAGSRWR